MFTESSLVKILILSFKLNRRSSRGDNCLFIRSSFPIHKLCHKTLCPSILVLEESLCCLLFEPLGFVCFLRMRCHRTSREDITRKVVENYENRIKTQEIETRSQKDGVPPKSLGCVLGILGLPSAQFLLLSLVLLCVYHPGYSCLLLKKSLYTYFT